MDPSSTITNPATADVFREQSGIIRMNLLENAPVVRKKDVQTLTLQRLAVTNGGEKQLVMMDVRSGPELEKAAKKMSREKETAPYTKAMAILVESAYSRIFGNMAIGRYGRSFPTKLFLNEAEARRWLLSKA